MENDLDAIIEQTAFDPADAVRKLEPTLSRMIGTQEAAFRFFQLTQQSGKTLCLEDIAFDRMVTFPEFHEACAEQHVTTAREQAQTKVYICIMAKETLLRAIMQKTENVDIWNEANSDTLDDATRDRIATRSREYEERIQDLLTRRQKK